MADGIRSKENVQNFGEVFTPDSIVNDMLDLVDNAMKENNTSVSEMLSKTYLEPACGDGQFLIRILDRKLALLKENVRKEDLFFHLVKALSTIYGVDIQKDNVESSRRRMKQLIKTGEVKTFDLPGKTIRGFTNLELDIDDKQESVLDYILQRNIVHGNTLETNVGTEMCPTITEYVFDGENVVMKEFKLPELDTCIDTYKAINYMNLMNAEVEDESGNGQDKDDWDF